MQPQNNDSPPAFAFRFRNKVLLIAGVLVLALLVLSWVNLPYGPLDWAAHAQPYEPPEPPPPLPPRDFPVIRLWADYTQRELLYEFDGYRLYEGRRSEGHAVYYFDGRHIFQGSNNTGERLYTIVPIGSHEWRLFAGPNVTGPLVYTIRKNRIRAGRPNGPVIYFVRGDDLLEGPNKLGPLVFHSNADLRYPPILLLLAPLADGRW
ncbi:MAG: hypothetical protein ACE5LU_24680 [Anaerolineae bacterium]